MRRRRLAVLGGTFDHLHVGHHALLASAFRVGDEVAIGVTTDPFVVRHPKPFPERMQTYATRRAALARWIRANYPGRKWRTVPLRDPFGGSLEPRVGVLVVSRDTERGGRAVNRERRRLGRAPVPIVTVPLVLADDLEPVSSRRIRSGEIAANGRRLAPIRIALFANNPHDRAAAKRAIVQVFPRARIEGGSRSGLPRRMDRTKPGARARQAGNRLPDLDLRISRRAPAGWKAVERSRAVRLRPRFIPGSRPADLERGLRRLLRPRE